MSIRACHVRDCQRTCYNGYDWYSPSEIRHKDGLLAPCVFQVMFLVACRECLAEMQWPSEPTGYTSQPSRPSPKSHGTFEDACMIAVPFLQRIIHVQRSRKGRAGLDRLDNEIRDGRGYSQLSEQALSVVIYLTKRRNDNYAHWLRQRGVRV